ATGPATTGCTGAPRRVAPVHYCTGAPSGPCMRIPTHTAQASREGGSDCWLQRGVPFRRLGVCARAGAGGVYEVCAVIAWRGAGRGSVVDQVIRLDRLPCHP